MMKLRTLVGWTLVSTWLLALPAWAVESCLQVTNLDSVNFSSYMEKATPWWRQNEPMEGLEKRLDEMKFPPAV